MGKLVESSQWEEDLYQIEEADPVDGGPDAVSNRQAKQLGGRTRYLKAQVEQSQTGLAQHIAAADPHTQYATKSDLAAKLAALVGQSPQTLDTLKELADALGNDPQFATTIMNQLGLKAPVDSPVFTGIPKGTTPAQFDNGPRLATTAFVLRALGSFSGFAAYNTNTTLTAATAGFAIQWYGSSGGVLTLPLGSTMGAGGAAMEFFNHGSGPISVTTQGSDILWDGGAKQPVTLQVGDSLRVVNRNGGAEWDISGGTAAIQFANVKGLTASQFDSSTSLATTEFVQKAGGNFQTRKYFNGSSNLVAADTGSWVEAGGAGPTTITLPSPATSNLRYTVTNVTSNGTAVTIYTPSASIYNQAAASSTISLDVGATIELVSDASNWTVVSHYTRSPSAQTPSLPDGSARLATTLFVKSWLQGVTTTTGVSASTTLNASAFGQAVVVTGGTPTITLPPANSGVNGQGILIVNDGGAAAGYATVAAAGGDVISIVGTSINLTLGESLVVVTNGSQWWPIGGTAMLKKTQRLLVNTVADDGSSALQVGGIAKAATPTAGDSSTSLATTAFANSVGGVVGSTRNGQMSVTAASSTATFTADEVVLETALGGAPIRLANFNNSINIAASGSPGGMDTGAAPVNGYVAIYAIYNPTTGASALLATNATNAKAPEVYGGANMPAGMKASALVSVWPTNGSGQFVVGYQIDRRISISNVIAVSSSSQVTSFTAVNASSIIPLNARAISGNLNISTTSALGAQTTISPTASTMGSQQIASSASSGGGSAGNAPFNNMPIITRQTFYWQSLLSSGTFGSGYVVIGGYEI
ncbi:hypothetical protein [Burkholderia sp. Ac-20344]|uniref:hypothetical protein n=1 Tax=Burkholderia sp. Ac-20344 TaxID=2703890 RepID=UPI00197B0CA9|nr:hypothetical protein [Burkholderia sp. Ac-20344]MBN3833700.1 hypothetical protein [Burkholderia sp. Ac-20344]